MAYFSYLDLAVIHAVCSICVFAAALQVALAFLIAFPIRSKQPGGRSHEQTEAPAAGAANTSLP